MKTDFIKEIFGLDDTETKKFTDGVSDLLKTFIKEAQTNDATKSYFNTKGCLYNNGELVEKYEKEYVDGKCIKDEKVSNRNRVENCEPKSNGGNTITDDGCVPTNQQKVLSGGHGLHNKIGNYRRAVRENEKLKSENESMKYQICEMTQYIDGLNDKIKKLEIEKSELKTIVDNIKNCL